MENIESYVNNICHSSTSLVSTDLSYGTAGVVNVAQSQGPVGFKPYQDTTTNYDMEMAAPPLEYGGFAQVAYPYYVGYNPMFYPALPQYSPIDGTVAQPLNLSNCFSTFVGNGLPMAPNLTNNFPTPEYQSEGYNYPPNAGISYPNTSGEPTAPIKTEMMTNYQLDNLLDDIEEITGTPTPLLSPSESINSIGTEGATPRLITVYREHPPADPQKQPRSSNQSSRSRKTTDSNIQPRCEACGKNFARVSGLTQHNATYHSGTKPFLCMKCGKRYATEEALTGHTERHDARDKPYKCLDCSKQFFYKMDLKRHSYRHTGFVAHSCRYCGKGYPRRDHCRSHELVHERRDEQAFIKQLWT